MAEYYVYILSNKSRMLYVGFTNNLERRLFELSAKLVPGFTKHYGLTKLVYYESTDNVISAISREKEIKGWVRRKKVALIHSLNPEWKELSAEWAAPYLDTLRGVHTEERSAQGDNKGAQGDSKALQSCLSEGAERLNESRGGAVEKSH